MTERRQLHSDTFKALLTHLPSDYSAAHQQLVEMTQDFRLAIASALQSRLNEYLKEMPLNSTLDQKRDVATKINSDLRELGLAIRQPDSGLPGIVFADVSRAGPGRYRIESRGRGLTRVRSASMQKLENLELIPDTVRIEVFSRKGGSHLDR